MAAANKGERDRSPNSLAHLLKRRDALARLLQQAGRQVGGEGGQVLQVDGEAGAARGDAAGGAQQGGDAGGILAGAAVGVQEGGEVALEGEAGLRLHVGSHRDFGAKSGKRRAGAGGVERGRAPR
jgi:hypothetical protein